MDALEEFKRSQKEGWAHFAPLEAATMIPAAKLVRFAGVEANQRLLDVACGTGVAALPAARLGAQVTALDLTPELLVKAHANAALAGVEIEFREGDVEKLPFADASFDVVISQFGHIFAPRPAVAMAEMLRVLVPGGRIALNTWPPEFLVGQMFQLTARYLPPPAFAAPAPSEWGDREIITGRLGAAVRDIVFESGVMIVPALSVAHYRSFSEKTAGPVLRLVALLEKADPAKLARYRNEYEQIAAPYFEDNAVRQPYLMTRAVKN